MLFFFQSSKCWTNHLNRFLTYFHFTITNPLWYGVHHSSFLQKSYFHTSLLVSQSPKSESFFLSFVLLSTSAVLTLAVWISFFTFSPWFSLSLLISKLQDWLCSLKIYLEVCPEHFHLFSILLSFGISTTLDVLTQIGWSLFHFNICSSSFMFAFPHLENPTSLLPFVKTPLSLQDNHTCYIKSAVFLHLHQH